MKRRILVIGLDGATFDIICPLIEENLLPNLKKLMDEGTYGSLQSTIPPVTGPAWLSLATGMTPEKIGVFDFVCKKESGYRLRGLTSKDYYGSSLWDYLSLAGKRVGILNYPMLKPPYEINGFMTAGIGASPDEDFTFPKELKEKLNKVVGGQYEITVPYHDSRYNDIERFLTDLNRVFHKQVLATEYLLKEEKWDLFWVVFSETDWAQHIMWRFIDESHSLYERENSRKYFEAFKEFWNKIDEAIGIFFQIAGENTIVFILSDHGFGPNNQIFKLNAWLEREGYLIRKDTKSFLAKKTFSSFLKRIAKWLKFQKLVPDFYRWGQQVLDSLRVNVVDLIDLERSMAFDPGHTIPFGGVYINDQLIKSVEERQKLAIEIADKLQKWGDQHGVKIEVKILNSRTSDKLRCRAPDLLIGINEWECILLKDEFDGEIFEERPYSPRHTGSHRLNGIFIAAGPDIRKKVLKKARLCDIAPTILYLFNEPISEDMDGEVLTEIFTPEYVKDNPVKLYGRKSEAREESSLGLTEEEEEALEKRLKDLGYM